MGFLTTIGILIDLTRRLTNTKQRGITTVLFYGVCLTVTVHRSTIPPKQTDELYISYKTLMQIRPVFYSVLWIPVTLKMTRKLTTVLLKVEKTNVESNGA